MKKTLLVWGSFLTLIFVAILSYSMYCDGTTYNKTDTDDSDDSGGDDSSSDDSGGDMPTCVSNKDSSCNRNDCGGSGVNTM